MKTIEELFADRDALAAVQTLVARGFVPKIVAEAMDRWVAHGQRRAPRIDRARRGDVDQVSA